jgi:hypothetical protein
VRDIITEEREEAAFAEACKLLQPLKKPARSWGVVSWTDPDAADPRDIYEAAVGFVIALLDPAIPTSSAQAETYDSRARQAADEFLGAHASIVRKVILPALRLGRPPKKSGPRSILMRDRLIATVVTTICQQYRLKPYRNPQSKHECNGCAVVAAALKRLVLRPTAEKAVERIYAKHK